MSPSPDPTSPDPTSPDPASPDPAGDGSGPPRPALPAGVARTALGVARIRAAESARDDRLFDDPFAGAFVDAAPHLAAIPPGLAEDDLRRLRWVAFYVTVRTRFYDDHLAAAVAAGCRQVALVAAGLDARAYRLDWPDGVRLVELDLPDVLAFKQSVLDARGARPRCHRTAVGTDLLGDWPAAATAAGLRPDEPTAWLVEGLLVYLDAAQAGTLLDRITALSAPGSRLACEVQGTGGRATAGPGGPGASGTPDGYTELWKGGLGPQLPVRLRDLGWTVDVEDRADVAARYGRPGPPSNGAGFLVARRPGVPA